MPEYRFAEYSTSKWSDEYKAEMKEKILHSFKEGKGLMRSCEEAGLSPVTFYNWRKADPELEAEVEEAKKSRIHLVEDSLYKKALEGNVTACISFLKNKAGWRDTDKPNDLTNGNNIVQVIIQNNVTDVQGSEKRSSPEGNIIEREAVSLLTEQS